MSKSKLLALWMITFVTGALVGGVTGRAYQAAHAVCKATCPSARPNPQADLLLAKLEGVTLPEGVREVAPEHTLKSSSELPSQLVRSELPEGLVLATPAATQDEEQKNSGIVLNNEQETVILNSRRPAQRAADGSQRTLIEAPLAVKRIKTLDEYKAFKTQARGSYPTADFAKEEVIVLESTSNLPDKVFEIVEIVPEGENLKVTYRVNVLGLDKKINTHSAQKINKTSLPIILEQVL